MLLRPFPVDTDAPKGSFFSPLPTTPKVPPLLTFLPYWTLADLIKAPGGAPICLCLCPSVERGNVKWPSNSVRMGLELGLGLGERPTAFRDVKPNPNWSTGFHFASRASSSIVSMLLGAHGGEEVGGSGWDVDGNPPHRNRVGFGTHPTCVTAELEFWKGRATPQTQHGRLTI